MRPSCKKFRSLIKLLNAKYQFPVKTDYFPLGQTYTYNDASIRTYFIPTHYFINV